MAFGHDGGGVAGLLCASGASAPATRNGRPRTLEDSRAGLDSRPPRTLEDSRAGLDAEEEMIMSDMNLGCGASAKQQAGAVANAKPRAANGGRDANGRFV